MEYFTLLMFLGGYVWIYFNVRQSDEKDFKRWAIPLAIFNIFAMASINVAVYFYFPAIVLMFPLHLIAVILAVCNLYICVDCGKWVDKDAVRFSKYKRCAICRAKDL